MVVCALVHLRQSQDHHNVACAAGAQGVEQVRGCIRAADQKRALPGRAGGGQTRFAPAAWDQDGYEDAL